MPPSRLDSIYRRLLITRFFGKGWGKPENLQRLFEFRKIVSNRDKCMKLIPPDYPVEIIKEEKTSECRIIEGKFLSPLDLFLPGLLPKVVRDAHFQIVLPNKWRDPVYKPVCIHLAGTGDHFYWRRRNLMAKPLMREANIGSIILENPFYGSRKPKDQVRSCLHNVSDIFAMGGCLILESLVLLNWCERNGFGPLGITGLSMGGHMASLAATNWAKPLVLVPCLSWSTASAVFTQGVMSQSINWDFLETQYFADGNYRERLAKMVQIVDDAFLAGQQFAKHFNMSVQKLQQDIHNVDNTMKVDASVSKVSIKSSPTPATATTSSVLRISGPENVLNLSPALFEKLLSKDKYELTKEEINELNIKIILAHNNRKSDHSEEDISNDKASTDMKTLTDGKNEMSSIASALHASRTKLMGLISPLTNNRESITPEQANIPKPPLQDKIDITKTKWWEREALQFMRGVMDECTHLKNFSVPFDTSLIIAVCAKDDAYVPRDGCMSLEEVWPGAEVRYLDAGHVSAYVLHQKLFRSSIIEAFERAKKKWVPYHEQCQNVDEPRAICDATKTETTDGNKI